MFTTCILGSARSSGSRHRLIKPQMTTSAKQTADSRDRMPQVKADVEEILGYPPRLLTHPPPHPPESVYQPSQIPNTKIFLFVNSYVHNLLWESSKGIFLSSLYLAFPYNVTLEPNSQAP